LPQRTAKKTDKEMVVLHREWGFRRAGKRASHRATAPGCMHKDLLDKGLIEDSL